MEKIKISKIDSKFEKKSYRYFEYITIENHAAHIVNETSDFEKSVAHIFHSYHRYEPNLYLNAKRNSQH